MPPMSETPLIDPARLHALLGPLAGRFDADSVFTIDSTNSALLRRAGEGAPSGLLLTADVQTAGRGRRGRQWVSSPADSLTFSLLWRFDSGVPLTGLSLAVGLAIADALKACGAGGIGLKWPNDILLLNPAPAKLGGILIELLSGAGGIAAIIGIGLNLGPPENDVGQPAAGLSAAMAPPLPERHHLLAALLQHLCTELDLFAAEGFAPLRARWQAAHAFQGTAVSLIHDNGTRNTGRCLGVDDQGALCLETRAGLQRFLSGDLSLRPEP